MSRNESLLVAHDVYVALVEYRETHGYAHVRLSDDGRTARVNLYFSDCARICGEPMSGPCSAEVSQSDKGVVLSTSSGSLEISADRVTVEQVLRGPT
jgi:hypothetical protein